MDPLRTARVMHETCFSDLVDISCVRNATVPAFYIRILILFVLLLFLFKWHHSVTMTKCVVFACVCERDLFKVFGQ